MSTATDPNPPTVKDGIGAAVTRIDGPAAACNAILHATGARIRDCRFGSKSCWAGLPDPPVLQQRGRHGRARRSSQTSNSDHTQEHQYRQRE